MPTNMTTLGEVSDRVDAMNQNCHDALVDVPAISFESLETMKIGGERHTLRTVAQRSIAWRLGIPFNYLAEVPAGPASRTDESLDQARETGAAVCPVRWPGSEGDLHAAIQTGGQFRGSGPPG